MIGRTNAVIGKSSNKYPSADDVQVTYTGTMEDPREITDAAGNKYTLYELKTAGKLQLSKEVIADICIIKGGNAGDAFDEYTHVFSRSLRGGDGGKMVSVTTSLPANTEISCVIGAGGLNDGASGGDTSIIINGIIYNHESYGDGDVAGTGGGGGEESYYEYGEGDGRTKYVFGDESVYSYPICAGGGGGLYCIESDDTSVSPSRDVFRNICPGGAGGTNGGNGEIAKDELINPETENNEFFDKLPEISPSKGGYYGGGEGVGVDENGDIISGKDGFTYGSGGGGGYVKVLPGQGWNGSRCGKGASGAIFIRILKY